MNLGISLSGEGTGHTTRTLALALALKAQHRLSIWCPVHTIRFLRPQLVDCQFFSLPVIRTVYRRNSIDFPRTVLANIPIFARSLRLVPALERKLVRMRIDAVLSDYEPFLPRAANRAGIPVILFNHQGVVNTHPRVSLSWLVARAVNAIMMPRAGRCITSSFYNGDVGPLLRPEITRLTPSCGDFIFVYAREAFREHIVPALAAFPETTFRVFPSQELSFARSLASCRAVIAPAGHQLTSEVLSFRKPMLVFPQRGQYEQGLNARMLVRSGWGLIGDMQDITGSIAGFLARLDEFPLQPPDPRVRFCLQDDTLHAVELINATLELLTGRSVPPRTVEPQRPTLDAEAVGSRQQCPGHTTCRSRS